MRLKAQCQSRVLLLYNLVLCPDIFLAISEALGDIIEFRVDCHEGFHHVGIEVLAAALSNDLDGFLEHPLD